MLLKENNNYLFFYRYTNNRLLRFFKGWIIDTEINRKLVLSLEFIYWVINSLNEVRENDVAQLIGSYYSVTYETLKILNIFVSFWENDEK